MNRKPNKKQSRKKPGKTFRTVKEFTKHYFPKGVERKQQGPLIILPRPGV